LIKITDKFSLERDGLNWTVHKYSTHTCKSGDRKGQQITTSKDSYFGKLEYALLDILNELPEGNTTVEALQLEVLAARKAIISAIKDIS
jgi:hypothetical protein